MATPLSLFTNDTPTTTLPSALGLFATGGATSNTHASVPVGTATGWGEVALTTPPASWPALGAIGAPSGKGLLFDDTRLAGMVLLAGTWATQLRLAASVAGVTVTLQTRYYRRSSSGVYTLIASATLSGVAPPTGFATYTLPDATTSSPTACATGDKLYVDIWANVTANTSGSSATTLQLGGLSQQAGIGSSQNVFATPGYQASTTQAGAATLAAGATATLAALVQTSAPRLAAQGGVSATLTPTVRSLVHLLPVQRGLQVLHAGQDISAYVMEDEEGSGGLHDLVSGDGIALGGSSASPPSPTALQIESTLAQGAGSSGAAGATATFTTTLGPAATAKGKAANLTGTDIVRQGSVIIKDATGTTIFGGFLTKLDDASEGLAVRTVFNCVDYWAALDRIEVQQVYTGMGDTAIIRALCTTYAPWLDLSLLPASQNYFFGIRICKGTLREVLQGIANITGLLIWADVQQRLRYLAPTGAEQANFALSDTPDSVSSFGYALTKYEVDDNAIINRCYFYGGKNTSPDFTQDLASQANGVNKVFMLAYPPEDAGDGHKHITLGGVDLAVGSVFDTSAAGKFKSAGGTSDVLINAGSRIAQFDVAPAGSPTTLTATYRYQTPLVVVLSSQQSFNFYGSWYDGRISDASVLDPQSAIAQCKLKLAQQAFGLVSLSLTTWTGGLQAGQLVHLTNTTRGINDTYLIQKVTANPLGAGQFSYDLDLGAWNWNLLDLLVENARVNNPTDGNAEEDTTVIQAHESVDAATVVTALAHTTHTSGQYFSGQPGTQSGFFTVTG